MSGIPEFRRGEGKGPELPPLRRVAGIAGLVAGILMGIGYVLLAITVFSLIGYLLVLAGSVKPEIVMGGAVAADVGVIALVIGIYSFIIGVKARKSHPGPSAASLTGLWAALLMVMYALAITNLAINGARLGAFTPLITGLVGAVLVLVAVFLVRPGSSFGAWVAGSGMGLAGLIIIIISKHMSRAAFLPGEGVPASTLVDVATLTYTPVLIGGIIAAIAALVAPFIGARRVWISEIIAAAGAVIAAASLAYLAAINIEPFYRVYELSSFASGDIGDILKLLGITGTASLGLIVASAVIGIVALVFAIIHLLIGQKQEASAVQAPPPPPPQ